MKIIFFLYTRFYTLFLPHSPGYCFHPWCLDGRAGVQQEKVCLGCISETVRCKKGHWLGGVRGQRHGVP